jgi:hypothetical protein
MAAVYPQVGTGASVTFQAGTGAAVFAQIEDIQLNGFSRGFVETTHMATTAARTFFPTDLYDPGEIVVVFQIDVNLDYSAAIANNGSTTACILIFPDSTGGSGAGGQVSFVGGFLTNIDFGVPLEDKMLATATVKLTGAGTWTDES